MTSIFSIVLFICNFLTNSWRERPKDAIVQGAMSLQELITKHETSIDQEESFVALDIPMNH